jgi:hypothetical protein
LLYAKTALALKSVDPTLKVGGDAVAHAGAGPYREGFIEYCAAHKLPLDFYSWHTYASYSADPYDAVRLARQIRGILDTNGFQKAESILSEWNLSSNYRAGEKAELESAHNAAYIGAVMSYFQDAPLDHAHFYRGDATWMGLFNPRGEYFKTAYAFKAMGKMLETPQRLAVEGTDTFGFAALAGRSADGKMVQIIVSNYAIPASFKSRKTILPGRANIVYRDNAGYNLAIDNLPWGKQAFRIKRYRISNSQNLELVEEKSGSGGELKLTNPLATDTVELIVLERR